jgi:hypothetical protein
MFKNILFTTTLSEAQKQKIKKSNQRFKKQFKYSISFVIAGGFIILGAILGLINSQGVPIGSMGQLIMLVATAGILGSFISNNIRAFDKEMEQEITEPDNDFLSSYLKQSIHTKLFKPEVYEKLTVLKLSKDEELKGKLLQEIVSSLDASIADIEKPDFIPLDKPVSTTERKSLMTTLEAAFKDANYDLSTPSKTSGIICSTADKLGASISENTVSKIIKQVKNSQDQRGVEKSK